MGTTPEKLEEARSYIMSKILELSGSLKGGCPFVK